MDFTKEEYLSFLRSWSDGTSGDWDFDDYTSVKIKDADLEKVRLRLLDLPNLYPSNVMGYYCNEKGWSEIVSMIKELEKMVSTQFVHNCRVCGLFSEEPPWGENENLPSFDICQCCGVTFGYQDGLLKAVRKFRQEWVENGMKWFDSEEMPENWSPVEQMKNIPPKFR